MLVMYICRYINIKMRDILIFFSKLDIMLAFLLLYQPFPFQIKVFNSSGMPFLFGGMFSLGNSLFSVVVGLGWVCSGVYKLGISWECMRGLGIPSPQR